MKPHFSYLENIICQLFKDLSQDLAVFGQEIVPILASSLENGSRASSEMLIKVYSKLFEESSINFCNQIKNLISSTKEKLDINVDAQISNSKIYSDAVRVDLSKK